MRNEFNILQELTVGNKIQHLNELNELLDTMDSADPAVISIMEETSQIMRDIASFTGTYANNVSQEK